MGFDLSDEQAGASYNFKEQPREISPPVCDKLPPKSPASTQKSRYVPSSQQNQKPPGSSLYRLISQKRSDSDKPEVQNNGNRSSSTGSQNSSGIGEKVKNVQFADDSFDSTEDDELFTRKPAMSTEEEMESESNAETQDDRTENSDESYEESEVNYRETEEKRVQEVVQQQPYQPPLTVLEESDDDDVSLSAFVPESVRRRSVLPTPPPAGADNHEDRVSSKPPAHPVSSVPSNCRNSSKSKLVGYDSSSGPSQTSSSSLESATSSQSSLCDPRQRHLGSTDTLNLTEEEDVGSF